MMEEHPSLRKANRAFFLSLNKRREESFKMANDNHIPFICFTTHKQEDLL